MQSVAGTGINWFIILISFLTGFPAFSQDNTPWSRYGVGDPVHSANIVNRGMGYVSAAYNDQQTINFVNPASYSRLGKQKAILDLGIDFSSRNLNSNQEKARFSYVYVPYLAGGFQLKGEKRKRDWGIAFGLKPVTRVNYNIETNARFGEDKIVYNYEGNGGAYQAFAGTGIAFKGLSIGTNIGYRFGSKDYTSRVSLFNDSISGRYTSGQKEVRNNFGGIFSELGLQYEAAISKKEMLTFGAFGSFASQMSLRSEVNISTFFQSGDVTSSVPIDSVSSITDRNGTMIYPAYYGIGFMYDRIAESRLSIGADFTFQNWKEFRVNNKPDLLTDAWQIKAGVQWLPRAKNNAGKSKNPMIYRAGGFYCIEPFLFNGNVTVYGFTLGLSIPIKKYSYAEYNRNNIIHLALESGRRGNASGIFSENYFRLAMSASLSDIWFIKSKYD